MRKCRHAAPDVARRGRISIHVAGARLRLQCGAGELAGGKSVAEAAYAAGFSDAAHMIEATPRQVLQRGFAARDLHLKG